MKRPGLLCGTGPALGRALRVACAAGGALLLLSPLFSSAAAAEETSANATPKPSHEIEWSEPARLATRALLLDAIEVDGKIVVVGDRGEILISSDGAESWTQAKVPTRSMLNAVAAVGDQDIWAVGHDAVIVHSGDGGETWERQFFAPEEQSPLFDVWFENASHGIAVGAYGLMLETHDGGETWSRRDLVDKEERHWYEIAETPDGTLIAAGEAGGLFRSRDKGQSWEILESPYGGTYFGDLALKDGAVLIFGLRGHLYRTEDQGDTWQEIHSGVESGLLCGVQRADGEVILGGLTGVYLVSTDGGRHFRAGNRKDRHGISKVLDLDGKALLLVGEGGVRRVKHLEESD